MAGAALLAQARPPAPQRPSLPATELDRGDADATLDSPRRLSLAFADVIPVRDVLFLIVRGTPFSIAFDPAVSGTFVGEIKGLTLRQALEAVLPPLGFDFDVQGTLIRVFPRRPETQLFDVNILAVQRAWTRTVGPDSAGTLTTSTSGGDPVAAVTAGIQSLLSPRGVLHVTAVPGSRR